jgi:hypothetical protein
VTNICGNSDCIWCNLSTEMALTTRFVSALAYWLDDEPVMASISLCIAMYFLKLREAR